ncbi:hypothetical protein TSUD_349400 [Trifolium subterraneum]|uniref:Reverse transcriptase zinc-binding domain-containing protein n=1 Tax=Trifolium subterraneum TaxID=3900 RepID=A0A2Z6NHL9_TRISU|nr:hypothetical protein TSUD_349400 [Trifolium subterraneum]
MLVDRGGLWFRALAARYGVERGCVREGGRNGSSWWREIVRIRDGVDGLGGRWFREGVVRKVGDGTESYFYTNPWVGYWRGGVGVAETFVGVGGGDARGVSVRGAYQLLTSHPSDPLDDVLDLIWHKQVPLKVSIFPWRLLRDRLRTKTNLVTRGIITSEAQACVAGCGGTETAQHLFISCSIFGSL